MESSFIPVFLSTDNNYAAAAYIALYSLLCNYGGGEGIRVYVLTPDDFAAENQSMLRSLSGSFPFADVRIIPMGSSYASVKINTAYISTATMYRLLIPRLVKELGDADIEKCIYLDSDLVVEEDISELFHIDMEDCCIAGVRERAISDKKMEELQIPSLDQYVNAGVLLMNLKEIEHCGLAKSLEDAGYRDDFRHNDQDAVNRVFYGKTKLLPLRFNAINQYLNDEAENVQAYGSAAIQEAKENPLIIHYLLKRKPWSYKRVPMEDAWWKYVKMQDRDTLRLYIRPFLKDHRLPLPIRVKETVLNASKILGVYPLLCKTVRAVKKRIKNPPDRTSP